MPANVETAVYSNTPAWHREGIVLDSDGEKGLTVEVALPASGLDWEVEKVPCYAFSGYREVPHVVDGKKVGTIVVPANDAERLLIPNRWAVQRTTDKRLFGVVGDTWQPTQNHEGFTIIDELIAQASGGTGRAWIESAMSLDEGKKVAILVHIENDWQIAGEDYMQYVLFTNGHDGRTSVTAATTQVRVVCQNTLALALSIADTPKGSGGGRVIRVRHTKNAKDRIKAAAEILGLRNQYAEQLAIQGEFLAEQTMTDGQFEKFLASLMPVEAEEGTPAHTMVTGRRAEVAKVYMTAPNLAPLRGTRWGALQAAIEYADYGREFKDDQSMLKNQFGLVATGTDIKDRAFSILKDPKLKPVAA